MITLQKARRILGPELEIYSDEDVHTLIGFLLLLARIEIETKNLVL